jgi:hypothetical protein
VDEADREIRLLEQYNEGLTKGPLKGNNTVVLDTTRINVPKAEASDD